MKAALLVIIAIAALCCFLSCTSKEVPKSIASDSTKVSDQIDNPNYSTLNENFRLFLSNFPTKSLPAELPSGPTYGEGDIKEIDESFVREFLNGDIFDEEPDHLYYLASLKIHPNLYSVLVYQVRDMGHVSYILINYNNEGLVLSSRILAYYESGGGMNSWATAVIEKDGKIAVSDTEEGRTPNYKEETKFTYKIYPNGAILPTGVPAELLTTYHNAVKKKEEYLIAPLYDISTRKTFSNSFKFRQIGDSIIFSPNLYFFLYDVPDEYDLIVDSYTKTARGHRLTLKDVFNKHNEYYTLTHLTLNVIKDMSGVNQIVFSASEQHRELLMGVRTDYVISQNTLSNYKTRELPFVEPGKRISQSGGLVSLWLESKDHQVKEWGNQHGFSYQKEETNDTKSDVYHRLYDSTNHLVVEAVSNSRSAKLHTISLYGPTFKTDHGGIGVGSTLGELLYAHEWVSAYNGEHGVIVSIGEYQNIYFILDYVAGPPDTELDIETLDENIKISHVEFRLD